MAIIELYLKFRLQVLVESFQVKPANRSNLDGHKPSLFCPFTGVPTKWNFGHLDRNEGPRLSGMILH